MDTEQSADTSRNAGWRGYVAIGLLATLVLFVLKVAVEHTRWGHDNQLWAFGKLQGSLSPIDLDNPLVVLDISSLPGGRVADPTPRNKLQEIIGALAEVQPQPPRAIAVDINFSPKGPFYAAEDDEDFFDFCLSIKDEKRIPVFLGVGETKSAPPEARLGKAAYKDLAVAIAGNKDDTSRIPLWVKSRHSPEELKTLNYALALEYRKRLAGAPKWIAWALETNVEAAGELPQHDEAIGDDATLTYADRLVNYSKLDQMKLAAQSGTSAEAVRQAGAKYSNKLVILGDLNSDLVPVPGRIINEPGSLALASATYTLIKEPLFEFKWWVGFLLDLVIAALIIVPVAIIRSRNPEGRVWVGKQALFVYAAVALVLFAGWKLVSWAGVLWLDFLLVAFAVFLHPKVEHGIDRYLEARAARRSTKVKGTSVEPGKTAVGVILVLMAASIDLFAQERAATPPRCQQGVAAIGLQLNTPPRKRNQMKVLTCYVRDNKFSKWQSLTATDAKRQYRDGQHLYCDEDCSLIILFCGTQMQYPVKTREPKWFPVINAYRPPPPLNDPHKDNFGRVSQSFSPPNPKPGPSPLPLQISTNIAIGQSVGGVIIGAIAGGNKGASIGAVIAPSNDRLERVNRAPASGPGGMPPRATSSDDKTSDRQTSDQSTSQTKVEFVDDYIGKGNDARQRGDYALAQQAYVQAEKLNPADHRSWEGLGNLFADQKKWSDAEKAYRSALRLDPNNVSLHVNLAVVMLQQENARVNAGSRLGEVEEVLHSANKISPSNEMVYALFEELFELKKAEPAQVEPLFRRAAYYNRTSAKANLRLARVLYQLERPVEAVKFLRQAENNATDQDLLAVARLYQVNGRYVDAERALTRARLSNPKDPAILYNLGSVLVQRKKFKEALGVLQVARQLDPSSFAPALVFGMAQLQTGDLAGAEITLNNASSKVKQQPDGPQRLAYWLAMLGDAYRSKGKLAEAIRVYDKSLIYNAANFEIREKLWGMRQQYMRAR